MAAALLVLLVSVVLIDAFVVMALAILPRSWALFIGIIGVILLVVTWPASPPDASGRH